MSRVGWTAAALAGLWVASQAAAEPPAAPLPQAHPAAHGQDSRPRPAGPSGPAPRPTPTQGVREALGSTAAPSRGNGGGDARIYSQAVRSVVLIITDEGLGSGSLISADGQILTNLHVVRNAKQIVVAFKPVADGAPLGKADGQPAKVLKIDETADLALLKVEKTPADVHPLPLGDSSQLQVGADVHAIGHPEGETWTYTRGVVSQVRRAYEWTLDEDKLPHEATVIQTQTPINPGNSGGPLLDGRGALIGVNTLVTRGAEGVNFAVSVEDVKSFLARAHDRAPARDKAAACEPKDIEEYDQKDPRAHVVTVDTDCDGKADSAWFTPKNRREPELYMTELTDKGTYASVYYDQDRDGETDWALYDSDGDGAYDYRGDFRKGEDQPYRWEKLAK